MKRVFALIVACLAAVGCGMDTGSGTHDVSWLLPLRVPSVLCRYYLNMLGKATQGKRSKAPRPSSSSTSAEATGFVRESATAFGGRGEKGQGLVEDM